MVHETVYEEIVAESVKTYVDNLTAEDSTRLKVHSGYDAVADNAKDRGEIRSLSYMAVKQYLYFAATDALPIRLIKNAEELQTSHI